MEKKIMNRSWPMWKTLSGQGASNLLTVSTPPPPPTFSLSSPNSCNQEKNTSDLDKKARQWKPVPLPRINIRIRCDHKCALLKTQQDRQYSMDFAKFSISFRS